jgi:hypothetical protein
VLTRNEIRIFSTTGGFLWVRDHKGGGEKEEGIHRSDKFNYDLAD